MMYGVGPGQTSSKTCLWCGASNPMPVLTMTRPALVTNIVEALDPCDR